MHRVLAFGCYPDDVEFICAGTLTLFAQRGCEIHIAMPSTVDENPRVKKSQVLPAWGLLLATSANDNGLKPGKQRRAPPVASP